MEGICSVNGSSSKPLLNLKNTLEAISRSISERSSTTKSQIMMRLEQLLQIFASIFLSNQQLAKQSEGPKSGSNLLHKMQLKLASLIEFHKELLKHTELMSDSDYYDEMNILVKPISKLLIILDDQRGPFERNTDWQGC